MLGFFLLLFPFQTAVEMRGSRNIVISSEVEYGSKPAVAFSRSAPGLRYHACMEYDVNSICFLAYSSVLTDLCRQGKCCKDNNIIACFSLLKSTTTTCTGKQK